MSKTVVVIGAGIGGLSASIRLARAGYRVICFEQHPTPGGKMREFRAGGFRWDAGPSVITMLPVIEDLFATAGERLEDWLTLAPVDPLTRYFFEDGKRLDVHLDRAKTAAQIAAIEPRDAAGYSAYLDHAAFLHQVTSPLFVYGDRPSPFDLPKVGVGNALRLEPFSKLHGSIKGYVRSPHIRQLLGRFATYIGSSPYHAPATLGVVSHVELNEGVWYPRDGVYSIARALHDVACKVGVDVRLGTPVQRIEVKNGRATGVTLASGEVIPADAVLANVDAALVYNRLLPQGEAPPRRARKLGLQRLSCSGFILLLGVRGVHEDLAHHNIFFCRDYRQEFVDIFDRKMPPAEPTLYASITCKSTPQDAPAGHENWYILVNAPAVGPEYDWNKRADEYRDVTLDQLARFGYELRDKIVMEQRITPNDIEAKTASWRGALYGELFDSPWVAFRRPRSRAGDVKGLYLCGGTAHPGGGVPMVMLSGKLAAKAIIEDYSAAG
ncbi:MAG: phytoene desaturase family protein [Anaerolineae bacterium]|nr:phytoene desaturase family protein [Anaerolineae bacterium]